MPAPALIQVALDAPLDRLFDYRAPDATPEDIGRRVRVPFGPREQVGVVVGLGSRSEVADTRLRDVIAIDRALPALPEDILQLARFAAAYYQHPLGQTLLAILPPALKRTRFRAPAPAAYALTEVGRAAVAGLPARATAQRRLAGLLAAGAVAAGELADLRVPLSAWLKRGWVAGADLPGVDGDAGGQPEPTADQAAALAALAAQPDGFAAWLLFGVTGSGKTEVYLREIERVLARGRQVLVLLPEIHLTPQMVERFGRRFPGRKLVSLHSGLSDGERLAAWLDGLEGRADIALGTRLAVFAPLPRLGLIVVDEEHDASYKQMEGLRYHARDVAVWRARAAGVAVLLGSATPALESWANARRGRYRLLSLPERAHADADLPTVSLVDSRTDKPRQGVTEALRQALADNLARGEQSLVFINRRGYAPVLYCRACGHVSTCPRCAAHQVVHRHRGGYQLRCHHCGLAARPPEACPACGSLDLAPAGQGTQKVEDTLAELFPAARILRIDRDTAARKGAFAAMRTAVERREVDILVGTQIVAKGHDFPMLTLVGVVGADQALMSTDFRASERLFAQLMQVGGRAGRAAHAGRVLIQTEYPHHPLYAALVRHDYPAFAERTLVERRQAEFPPYSHQALMRADARSMTEAMAFLERAHSLAEDLAEGVLLYDPVPALMPRIAERERAQLLVQSGNRARLQAFLTPWLARLRDEKSAGLRWSVDVDPLDW
ncbi:primosomal protein N' [Parasulfuritortus cantonensis]|uniref:Replication restart protein PriA n=2 Tax=Parasulfuritortus cantonensis TaxID=2528202 RepID=A0A4R1BCM5_9PROT|nr:primosomal protein N' [Parasulfuritortus cantonensis]TCJ14783.1 primosomal protein N' [Parasulfuritortus cantonensis]